MKEYKTRYPELNYFHNVDHWRIIATDTHSSVGPYYHSRAELLADLERYASEYGCVGASIRGSGLKLPGTPQTKKMIDEFGLDIVVQAVFEKYEWIRELMKDWHETEQVLVPLVTACTGLGKRSAIEKAILMFLFGDETSYLAESFFKELCRITKPIDS